MSGGSYNYLCYRDSDDIFNSRDDLRNMADRLVEFGVPEAATETEKVIQLMSTYSADMDALLDNLRDLWHAVEWRDSCDSTDADVHRAIAEYRGEPEGGDDGE